MTKMRKEWLTITAAGLALSLMAAPAAAQQGVQPPQERFQAWDVNQDGAIDPEEFANRFGEAGVAGEWDANEDETISEQEFSDELHGLYDDDGSGAIEEPEYGELQNDLSADGFWGARNPGGRFGDLDRNQDARVDSQEFAARFGETALYEDFDANRDGAITEEEFNEGLFDRYDADDSGVVEEPEYQRLDNDMGDQGHWDRTSPNISR